MADISGTVGCFDPWFKLFTQRATKLGDDSAMSGTTLFIWLGTVLALGLIVGVGIPFGAT